MPKAKTCLPMLRNIACVAALFAVPAHAGCDGPCGYNILLGRTACCSEAGDQGTCNAYGGAGCHWSGGGGGGDYGGGNGGAIGGGCGAAGGAFALGMARWKWRHWYQAWHASWQLRAAANQARAWYCCCSCIWGTFCACCSAGATAAATKAKETKPDKETKPEIYTPDMERGVQSGGQLPQAQGCFQAGTVAMAFTTQQALKKNARHAYIDAGHDMADMCQAVGGRTMTIPIEDIRFGRRIDGGIGSTGCVYQGTWNCTEVAIKTVASTSPALQAMVQRASLDPEIQRWHELNHPHIALFLGACRGCAPHAPGFEQLMLVNELLASSLYSLLHVHQKPNTRKKLKWSARVRWAWHICCGMEYLHENSLLHLDLKSPNVLLSVNSVHAKAKIADFGNMRFALELEGHAGAASGNIEETARKIDNNPFSPQQVPKTRGLGTPEWMAPELLEGSSNATEKCDVYSFSMIMYELLTGKRPYKGFPGQEVVDRCGTEVVTVWAFNGQRPMVPETCPHLWSSLMAQCWDANASKRPSFGFIGVELKARIENGEIEEWDTPHSASQMQKPDAAVSGTLRLARVHSDGNFGMVSSADSVNSEEGSTQPPVAVAVGRLRLSPAQRDGNPGLFSSTDSNISMNSEEGDAIVPSGDQLRLVVDENHPIVQAPQVQKDGVVVPSGDVCTVSWRCYGIVFALMVTVVSLAVVVAKSGRSHSSPPITPHLQRFVCNDHWGTCAVAQVGNFSHKADCLASCRCLAPCTPPAGFPVGNYTTTTLEVALDIITKGGSSLSLLVCNFSAMGRSARGVTIGSNRALSITGNACVGQSGPRLWVRLVVQGKLFLTALTFRNQTSTNYSGTAVEVASGGLLRATNVSFRHLETTHYGGAVHMTRGSEAQFYHCLFDGNQASKACVSPFFIGYGHGGAIRFDCGCTAIIDACVFSNCYSNCGGGAIAACSNNKKQPYQNNITITRSTFTGNRISQLAGTDILVWRDGLFHTANVPCPPPGKLSEYSRCSINGDYFNFSYVLPNA